MIPKRSEGFHTRHVASLEALGIGEGVLTVAPINAAK